MSSSNDTHHHLFVQSQPKSILKKSPSPRYFDLSTCIDDHPNSSIILSSNYERDENIINTSQFDRNDTFNLSSLDIPLTKPAKVTNDNLLHYKLDNQLVEAAVPIADATSPSSSTSDEEKEVDEQEQQQQQQQQQRARLKSKKTYSRSFVINSTLSSSASSSDNNDERQAKKSLVRSRTASTHSSKSRQKDMQLDEFIRKYQHEGGIHIPTITENRQKDSRTISERSNNNHRFYSTEQQISDINKRLMMSDDTLNLLESLDKITLSTQNFSPLQILLDVARTHEYDRRMKIDQIRQYVEDQIGITAFLTIYKLIKSSQIPIDIEKRPFCYYLNFIPHLCCLIMLESQQQKHRS